MGWSDIRNSSRCNYRININHAAGVYVQCTKKMIEYEENERFYPGPMSAISKMTTIPPRVFGEERRKKRANS
jgi:hypothetical protein